MNNYTWHMLEERSRTYYYKEYSITFKDICKMTTRPSGYHMLESISGEHFIVSPGWFYIKLDIDNWSY